MGTPIQFRRVRYSEIGLLQEFIATDWSASHIFLSNRDLLEWQHRDRVNPDLLNFFAVDEGGTFTGVLGYIPTRQFSELSSVHACSLAIWKVSSRSQIPGAGLMLLKTLVADEHPDIISAVGVSDQALAIYRRLGYETGEMDHFFIGDGALSSRVTLLPEPKNGTFNNVKVSVARKLNRAELQVALREVSGDFSSDYYVNRYLEHPWYEYEFFSWEIDSEPLITVHREVFGEGFTASRIIDVIGRSELVPLVSNRLEALRFERGWAYVDIVSKGLDKVLMASCGFKRAGPAVGFQVPHHFEPYEPGFKSLSYFRNVFQPELSRRVVFLGHSDQDRPNHLMKKKAN